jgi:hypothetical protein
MIYWNVDLQFRHLQRIEARRRACHSTWSFPQTCFLEIRKINAQFVSRCRAHCHARVLCDSTAKNEIPSDLTYLPDDILDQLRSFVT